MTDEELQEMIDEADRDGALDNPGGPAPYTTLTARLGNQRTKSVAHKSQRSKCAAGRPIQVVSAAARNPTAHLSSAASPAPPSHRRR